MSSIILRDYQEEALTAVIKEFQAETFRQLIVLPTAAGKTFVMAAIAKHFNKKVLIIAHREELLHQAEEKLKTYWPEADIGYCKSERKEFDHQIVLGSTQTCCRPNCLWRLKEKGFDIFRKEKSLIIKSFWAQHKPAVGPTVYGDSKKKVLIF